MRLRVLLPNQILVDQEVRKVVAEAENGSFGLLERHIDFVAGLVPGILIFETEEGTEEYIGLDEGILVKAGAEVFVSTRQAVRGHELGRLWAIVREQFQVLDDREKKALSASARLEADLIRRFMELSGT